MSTAILAKIAGAQTVVTTAETVIYTSPALAVGIAALGIWFSGDVQATWGAGAASVTIRLRATNVSGAIIDTTVAQPVTAAASSQVPFNLLDLSEIAAQPGGQVYVITVQIGAATGNTTVNGGHIGVEV